MAQNDVYVDLDDNAENGISADVYIHRYYDDHGNEIKVYVHPDRGEGGFTEYFGTYADGSLMSERDAQWAVAEIQASGLDNAWAQAVGFDGRYDFDDGPNPMQQAKQGMAR